MAKKVKRAAGKKKTTRKKAGGKKKKAGGKKAIRGLAADLGRVSGMKVNP